MKATWKQVDKFEPKKDVTLSDLKEGDWFLWKSLPSGPPKFLLEDKIVWIDGSLPVTREHHPGMPVIPIKVHIQYEIIG